jgi:hypothetical protein
VQVNAASGFALNRVLIPFAADDAAFFGVEMLPNAAAASLGNIRRVFVTMIQL